MLEKVKSNGLLVGLGLLSAAVCGVAGYRWSSLNASKKASKESVSRIAIKTKSDPETMKMMSDLVTRAADKSKRKTITSLDMDHLEKLCKNESTEIRIWAFGAIACLNDTPHRDRAIELIGMMKDDSLPSISSTYFVKAYALRAPDWEEATKKALDNPKTASQAKQILAVGAKKGT